MLTKADKNFLRENFTTKDDLKKLAKQKDLLEVKKKLTELSDYAIPALGNIFRWTDDLHAAMTGRKSSRRVQEN